MAAAVAVGRVKGAMMKPCRSFKFRNVELISFAGVLKVYLHAAPSQCWCCCCQAAQVRDVSYAYVAQSFCLASSLTSASARIELPLWNHVPRAVMGLLLTLVSPATLTNAFCAPKSYPRPKELLSADPTPRVRSPMFLPCAL